MLAILVACSGGSSGGSTPQDSTPPDPTGPPTSSATYPFDAAAGFERAADGAINRVADVPSSPEDYPFGTGSCYGSLSDTTPECTPGGCTEHPNGRCAAESCLNTWCTCVYACSSDADCAADEACLRPEHGLAAGVPLPQCVPAACRTGADCDSGECGVSVVPASPTEQLALVCRTATDACRVDADCEDAPLGDLCSGTEVGWSCACASCWCD